MAINGWCNNKSTSWGKKVQNQIPQTEVNQVPNVTFLVDGQGIPLGITVDVAKRHDMKMTKATLQSIVICRPTILSSSSSSTTNTQQQHIYLDKGYDYPEVYELLEEYGYTIHICKRGGRLQ